MKFNLMLHSNNLAAFRSGWFTGEQLAGKSPESRMHPISKFEIRAAPSKHLSDVRGKPLSEV